MNNNNINRLYDPNALLYNYKETLAPQNKSYLIRIQKSQRKLIQESLLMIIGIQSQSFKYDKQQGYTIQALVEVKHLTPLALQNIILFFVQFSNRIKYIQNKLEILIKRQGIILNSFVFTIKQYIKQLKYYYAQILGLLQFQSGKVDRSHTLNNISNLGISPDQPMTLISLNILIRQQNQIIQMILILLKKCLQNQYTKQNNQSAVLVLNLFWDMLDKFQHQQIQSRKSKIILNLLEVPLKQYLDFIKKWLKGKQLIDPFGQFYIHSTGEGIQNYCIRKGPSGKDYFVPVFLRDFSNDIFLNGRFIKILYSFVDQTLKETIWQYLSIDFHFKKLQALLQKKQKYNEIKKFKPLSISLKLENKMDKTVRQVSTNQQLPYGLNTTTEGVFQFMKISRASTAIDTQQTVLNIEQQQNKQQQKHQTFLSEFKIIFQITLKDTLKNIIKKCEQYFCFKNNINQNKFSLLRNLISIQLQGIKRFILFGQGQFFQQLIQTLDSQLNKTISIISHNNIRLSLQNALKNSNARYLQEELTKNIYHKFLSNQKHMTGWDLFCLEYKVEYPLILMFPKFIMQRYNGVFNFLWKLKRLQNLVKKLWIQSFRNKKSRKVYFFINCLSQFSNGIISQIMLKIEIQWNKFLENTNKIGNFYQFIQLHQQLLNCLQYLTYQTTKQKTVISQLNSIFQVSVKFYNMIIYSYEEQNAQVIQEQTQKASKFLKDLIRQVLKSEQSLPKQIMDFNDYYDI